MDFWKGMVSSALESKKHLNDIAFDRPLPRL